jgi:D-threo-aldose 1-dehydrogenase
MVAGRCSLLRPHGFDELVPVCGQRGTRIVAASPFNSGLLATPRPRAGALYDYRPASPEILARVTRMADACERHGVDLPTAAVQFPLRLPHVASVVVGTARAAAVEENLARIAAEIPGELWAELASIDEEVG